MTAIASRGSLRAFGSLQIKAIEGLSPKSKKYGAAHACRTMKADKETSNAEKDREWT